MLAAKHKHRDVEAKWWPKGGVEQANSPIGQKANTDYHTSVTSDTLHGRKSHRESSGDCDVLPLMLDSGV